MLPSRTSHHLRLRLTVLLLCGASLLQPPRAEAQVPVSGAQAAGIFAIMAGIGVGIGFGIYYIVRQPPTITGCAASTSSGLELQGDRDHQLYTLLGDTSSIPPGNRVQLSGKRNSASHQFRVTRVRKNLGPCNPHPAIP